jgi:anti-sigma regulatory factor (Ser/Thr protein kinase)
VSRDVVTLVIPARTEYLIVARLALAGIARGAPIDDGALADLKLAVTEACGNAIRHAQPSEHGVVRVDFDLEDGAIEIRVSDAGPGIRALPDDEPDELAESGMGLAIIRALVDDFEIRDRDTGQGTIVRMRKRLAAA